MSSSIGSEVIDRVQQALEIFAAAKKTPTFSDIEASVGIKFRRDQWHQEFFKRHKIDKHGPKFQTVMERLRRPPPPDHGRRA